MTANQTGTGGEDAKTFVWSDVMIRLASLFLLVLPAAAFAADPEKPVTLKDDELAVLADPASPDRWTVMERYAGKVVKIEGRVFHNPGGSLSAPDPNRGYALILPKKKPADPTLIIHNLNWSQDPSTRKIIDEIEQKAARDRRVKDQKSVERGVSLVIYTRLEKGDFILKDRVVLADVATDPKIGGVPYKPKEKEPARLKK
jgi:hypothetical protein